MRKNQRLLILLLACALIVESILVIRGTLASEDAAAARLRAAITATGYASAGETSSSSLESPDAIFATETPAWTMTPPPTYTPTLFPLPGVAASPTPCEKRFPTDLLAQVTAVFGISSAYVPPDLVKLGRYVSGYVALPESKLRREAARALGRMVKTMRDAGLRPTVLSAYRSYTAQYISYRHWMSVDPVNAPHVSQKPGHSEHQLGTAVDFGSPGLAALTGDPTEKFSPLFSQTDEGLWLERHAFEYGFTLTNPLGAEWLTGLTYEPWHYRYVGMEMAAYLHASGFYLAEYLSLVQPGDPCIP